MQVVRNLNTLKAMQRAGYIELSDQTGSKISGLYGGKPFTCYYIESGCCIFTYKGSVYNTKYFSGCFNPYVVKVVA